jgi:hypothetical protein
MLRLFALVAALGVGTAGAHAAAQAQAPAIKVIGFAAIFDNDLHVVHAKNGGTLRRCEDPRAFAVVLDVANVERGPAYQLFWTANGKPIYASKQGKSGYFDAQPNRIELSFRKVAPLPDGAYVFRFVLDGSVRATAKVTRKCG